MYSAALSVHSITTSHPQLKLCHNSSLCLRMAKHRRVAQPDRVSCHITHQKCLNTKGRSLTAVPALSKTLEQEGFQNPKPPYYSNSASHMTMPMKTFSCQSTSPTLMCLTTSSAIRKATSEESVKSSASLESPQWMSKMSTVDNQQMKPTLLERLSNHALPCQTMETTSMRKGPTLTMAHYHGMSQRTQAVSHRKTCPHPFRKPMLSLRISLKTLSERVPPCLTATYPFHSFPLWNGLTCSMATPSTLTTSSPISTQFHTIPETLWNSVKMSSSSTDLPPQQKPLKPMAIGLSPGTASLMPCCSSSSIKNKSYDPMASTSNDTSRPCHPSCIAGSSITSSRLH